MDFEGCDARKGRHVTCTFDLPHELATNALDGVVGCDTVSHARRSGDRRGGSIKTQLPRLTASGASPGVRIAILTQLPWIAQRVAQAVERLGHRVAVVVAPARSRSEWKLHNLLDGNPAFVQRGSVLAQVLRDRKPEALVCWCYPWKVQHDALSLPPFGCINLHPSLLPRHRGPMPLAWALRSGDGEIGVTWHRMVEDFDAGSILAQASFPIRNGHCTPDDFWCQVDGLALMLLPDVLRQLSRGAPGLEQRHGEATWAPPFDRDDYAWVNWSWPAQAIHDQVRAWALTGGYPPIAAPVAKFDGHEYQLLRTSVTAPGDSSPRVQTSTGPLWLTRMRALDERGTTIA